MTLNYLQCQLVFFYEIQIGKGSFIKESWVNTNKMNRSAFTILLTVMFLDLLSGMEFDLFVPSLPEIQHFFHLTAFWAEALLAINFIGYCVSLFVFGKYEY